MIRRSPNHREIDRPVEGPRAYPGWLARVRSVLGLAAMTGLFGVLVAVAVGVVVFGLAALLDYAISR